VGGVLTKTSNGSPALIWLRKTGPKPETTLSLWPVVRSKSGPTFSNTVAIALAVRILTSAAFATETCEKATDTPKLTAARTVHCNFMVTSQGATPIQSSRCLRRQDGPPGGGCELAIRSQAIRLPPWQTREGRRVSGQPFRAVATRRRRRWLPCRRASD